MNVADILALTLIIIVGVAVLHVIYSMVKMMGKNRIGFMY